MYIANRYLKNTKFNSYTRGHSNWSLCWNALSPDMEPKQLRPVSAVKVIYDIVDCIVIVWVERENILNISCQELRSYLSFLRPLRLIKWRPATQNLDLKNAIIYRISCSFINILKIGVRRKHIFSYSTYSVCCLLCCSCHYTTHSSCTTRLL
jgi:hypothetical protein